MYCLALKTYSVDTFGQGENVAFLWLIILACHISNLIRFQITGGTYKTCNGNKAENTKTLERDYFRKVFSYNWRDTSQKMSRFSLTKKENWISFLCFVCTPIFGLLECWNYYRIEEQKVQNCFFETAILVFFSKLLHPLKSSQSFFPKIPFKIFGNSHIKDFPKLLQIFKRWLLNSQFTIFSVSKSIAKYVHIIKNRGSPLSRGFCLPFGNSRD